jgi:hypothetical protein
MSVLILISFLLAALRIGGVTAAWFQAAAHMFLGYLLGASVFGPQVKRELVPGVGISVDVYMLLFVGLSLVEVICFLVFKFAL